MIISKKKVLSLISIIISFYFIFLATTQININFNNINQINFEYKFAIYVIIIFLPIFYLLSIKFIFLIKRFKKINFYNSFEATIISYTYN